MFGGLYFGESYLGDSASSYAGFLALLIDDTIETSDAIAISIGKNVEDAAVFSDLMSLLSDYNLIIQENTNIFDSIAKQIAVLDHDVIAIDESIVKTISTNFSDTASVADIISKTAGIDIDDDVSVEDYFDKLYQWSVSIIDSIQTDDSITKQINVLKNEPLLLSEHMSKHASIDFSEALSVAIAIKAVRMASRAIVVNEYIKNRVINDASDDRSINDKTDDRLINSQGNDINIQSPSTNDIIEADSNQRNIN